MSAHLKDQHEITGPYRRTLTMALDMARGAYQNNYQWFQKDGETAILAQQCGKVWQKDAKRA
jgi:hypothetical protein